MTQVKYKIYRLSARAIIGYGKEQADGYYNFKLNKRETGRCILSGVQEQYDHALFYQIMDELHGGVVSSSNDMIIEDLADVIVHEPEEFKAYTSPVEYKVSRKGDTSFLGRFTFESMLNFEGMVRILTIIT